MTSQEDGGYKPLYTSDQESKPSDVGVEEQDAKAGSPIYEAGILTAYAIPAFTSCLAQFSLGLIDVIFIGRLDKKYLAAAAIGNVWAESTLMFCIGILNAMDTLIPQAYAAGNMKMVGDVLQVAHVVALTISVPLGVSWYFAEHILLLFKQDPGVAEMAGYFCKGLIVGAPFALMFQAQSKFLQGQGMMVPPLLVTISCIFLNVLFNWLFIYHFDMKFHGAPWATSASRFCLFALIMLATLCFGGWRKMTCPNIRVFCNPKGLAQFLKLGIPSGFLLGSEQWGIDILTLAAGWLGSGQLQKENYIAAHSIGVNVINTTFMMPLGFSIAGSIRVGHLVGQGNVRAAKTSGLIVVIIALSLMCISAVGLYFLRRPIAKVFMSDEETSSQDVLDYTQIVLPIAAIFQIADGIQCAMGGVLRGMGKPGSAFLVFLVGFYMLGIPLSFVLAFVAKMELAGIWWGLTAGLFTVSFGMVLVWSCTNWNKVLRESQDRTGVGHSAEVSEVLQEDAITTALLSKSEGSARD